MSDDILDWSAGRIAEAVGDGSVSAREVTTAFLARIEAVNPVINAVCTLNEQALDVASEIDRRRAAGEPARPLEGVPFLVKDILQTKGIRTTFGSLLLEHDVPEEDTVTVERLKAAGGVLLGKTNTPEFAHDINTTNKIFGTTRNPWDVNVTAGGSSGGSGAAVAAGMAPLALGTDLGGSIRIPCSFNNLTGLRP
ncbi:MAG: amidase, partial [Proteobacteria bacterium]|nr:amidase [Pseudomonadota bacterium]